MKWRKASDGCAVGSLAPLCRAVDKQAEGARNELVFSSKPSGLLSVRVSVAPWVSSCPCGDSYLLLRKISTCLFTLLLVNKSNKTSFFFTWHPVAGRSFLSPRQLELPSVAVLTLRAFIGVLIGFL